MKLTFKGIYHKPTKCKDGFYVKLVRVMTFEKPYVKMIAVNNNDKPLQAGNIIAINDKGIYRNYCVTDEINLPHDDTRIKIRT
jgi:hypothetical protein